jgi:hypothetical protein
LNLIALEQFLRGRAIAVIFNNAELPAASDNRIRRGDCRESGIGDTWPVFLAHDFAQLIA